MELFPLVCYMMCTLLKFTNRMQAVITLIFLDGIFGFDRNIVRRCVFPTDTYPFICTGSKGTPGTRGEDLGSMLLLYLS